MERRWQIQSACNLTLAGAGTPLVSGEYCEVEPFDGRRMWVRSGTTGFDNAIFWAAIEWVIQRNGTVVYTTTDEGASPEGNYPINWVTAVLGTDPAPLVSISDGWETIYADAVPKWTEEEDLSVGCVEKRLRLDGPLTFSGDEYVRFLAVLRNPARRCEPIKIRRQWKCLGGWRQLWQGVFSVGAGEWDHDACLFNIRPEPDDEYTCIMRAMKRQVNVLGAEQVVATANIPVDIEFGFSYAWTDTGTPPTQYASRVGMVDGSSTGVNGWGLAQTFYIGLVSREYSGGVIVSPPYADGEMSGFEGGSGLVETMMDAYVASLGGPGIGTELYEMSVYRWLWWRERETVPCEFGSSSPPLGSGWVLFDDNCSLDNTAIYGRPPALSYSSGNAYATGIISPSPGPSSCLTNIAAGPFGFDSRPMFVCFDVAGVDPIEFTRGRMLQDVANFLLDAAGCEQTEMVSDFLEWNAPGDAPGYSPGTNYVTGLLNTMAGLIAIDKSDAVDPGATQGATIGMMTLEELFVMFAKGPRLFWRIIDGKVRIEHWSFWTTPVGLSMMAFPDAYKSEPLSHVSLKTEIPRIERGKAAEARGQDFVGADLRYSGPCVTASDEGSEVLEHNVGNFTFDIELVITDPDAIDDSAGWVILATVYDGVNNVTISEPGALTGSVIANAPLSWANLQRDFWQHDRFLPTGLMNNVQTTFQAYVPNIEQRNVILRHCCGPTPGDDRYPQEWRCCLFLDFDSSKRVATRLGTLLGPLSAPLSAVVRRAEYDEAEDTLTMILRYSY